MIDKIAETSTNEAENEIPFTPFKTPFAKRICKIAGVEKILNLQGMQVMRCDDESGKVSQIDFILHSKAGELYPENIRISLIDHPEIKTDIILCNSDTFPSGIYCKGADEERLFYKEFHVMIGPDERLLCTPDGKLADNI